MYDISSSIKNSLNTNNFLIQPCRKKRDYRWLNGTTTICSVASVVFGGEVNMDIGQEG